MIIGLDLDNVSGDYTDGLRMKLAELLNVAPEDIAERFPAPTDYGFGNWGKEISENFSNYHAQAVTMGLYKSIKVMEGASEALWRLSDEGQHIRVITSRFVKHGQNGKVVADTAFWLDTNDIPYRDLMFVKEKIDAYADLYIDDAPTNIEAFRKAGRDYVIFDTTYNQGIEGPRVYGWGELEAYVRKFSKEKAFQL